MEEAKVFFGGVSTDPDIKMIRDVYPDSDLGIGILIPYEAIAQVIRQPDRHTYRYRTVTWRWRKLVEKESGIVIGTVAGQGFKVLDEHEKAGVSQSKGRTAIKSARRSLEVGSLVDTHALKADEIIRFEHSLNVSTSMLQVSRMKSKKALAPKAKPSAES